MIVKYRSHTFTVPDCDLIVMGDSFYAKVDLGQRGQSFPHYVKVEPPVAEVADPRLTGMDYCYPMPDPRTTDNITALTEILNSRDPERQKSRDLYTDDLYWQIAQAVAA